MGRLTGKTVLVAGGGFIGNGLACRYAEEGASVVIGDLRLSAARSIADGIVDRRGKALAVELDGTDEDSIRDALEAACAAFGGLDGLHVNFASFADSAADQGVTDLAMEAYDEAMHVNARGYVLCTRHALPELIRRGGGSIVYTSSAAAYLSEPTRFAYAMSKAAVNALMRHVAVRYAQQGVRANCIAPGIVMNMRGPDDIDHPTLGKMPPEFLDWAFACQLNKTRVANPGDIAAAGALLMSDEGSFITGQVLNVDGGATLRP